MIFRILLVDDETAIVDWLNHLISQTFGEEVEVYKTTNPVTALKILSTARFDIVMLDISMPAISGITILDEISEKYGETKVIFLTGLQQFEYARKAVDKNVIAYILKNESDDELLEAIKKAMARIREEIEQRGLVESARIKLDTAVPALKREFIIHLVQGLVLPEELKEIDKLLVKLNINPEIPICLMICSISEHLRNQPVNDRIKMLFAAGLSVEETMDRYFIYEYAMPDETSLVWLIQRKDSGGWDEEAYSMLRTVLENAQTIYNRNTNGNLIFIHSSKPVTLNEIPGYYVRVRPLLGYAGAGAHAVFTDEDLKDNEAALIDDIKIDTDYEPAFRKAAVLQRLLEQGEKEEFFNVLGSMLLPMEATSSRNSLPAVETFMTVSAVLISYINKTGMITKISFKCPIYKLYNMNMHQTWVDAGEYFRMISGFIFEMQNCKRETHAVQVIAKAREYIVEHLNEDLSLIMLADKVYLNPSYFSVLFKAKTGMNLSEFIKQERIKKAKSLLEDKKLRINEISRMIGYNNAAYFTKFFKSEMGISPMEYRDSL